MIIDEYNVKTGEWTEIEIFDPELISKPGIVSCAENNYTINEIFQFTSETYRALTNINNGDELIFEVNYEPINLIKFLNEQNAELKTTKILLGID